MNLAALQWPVFKPYEQATVEIYLSGCRRNCKGCHNPELRDFNFGKKLDYEEVLKYLEQRVDLFKIISITGGDPLLQDLGELQVFVDMLTFHFSTKLFWLFTGAEFEEVPEWCKKYFQVIKTGIYNVNEKQEGFPASKNQKVWRKGKDY
jgi:anaerobic ribonucleoside-triphosphate reductase activating protein